MVQVQRQEVFMFNKSLFSPAKSALRFPVLENINKESPVRVPEPETAVLHAYGNSDCSPSSEETLSIGDSVKTGQLITAEQTNLRMTAVSPVTGVVSRISERTGYAGSKFAEIVVKVDSEERFDDTFRKSVGEPAPADMLPFLDSFPGHTDFSFLSTRGKPVRAFVVYGIDSDPFTKTNQFILSARTEELKTGIEKLRLLFRGCKIFMVVPPYLEAMARTTGAKVAVLDPVYPFTLPAMVMKTVFGLEIPAGKRVEEIGVSFVSPETLVAMTEALETGRVPVHKHLTLIDKSGCAVLVRTRIGTPVRDVFNAAGVHTSPGDLLVQGSVLTGRSIHNEETPVLKDTDALFVRDKAEIPFSSESHCINCGECIRACPAAIPVNMLVRVLENGLWEDAVALYDLESCIECGLCSYVCPAKIPVFQYIMLGKDEAERIARAEATDVQG